MTDAETRPGQGSSGVKDYVGEGITVHWDARRCIHFAVCTRTLPEVFDVRRRPWILVDGADADSVAATVARCPTGALQFTTADGRREAAATPTTAQPIPGGPLLLRGDLSIHVPGASEPRRETRAALCRCGRSRNQPFCDNSHASAATKPPAPVTSNPESPSDICGRQPAP